MACKKKPVAVAKAKFRGVRRLDGNSEVKEMSYVARCSCRLGRDAYARKAKRPAAAAPTRPSLTEREPAALSLSCSSPDSEEPPLPVELAPEEEVVKEPEAVGPVAGTVPLVWGKGAATAVVVGAGAVAISASEARAEDSEMALSTAVWTASETELVATSAPAAALSVAAVAAAVSTAEETAEATSGFSATADVTAAEASAAGAS